VAVPEAYGDSNAIAGTRDHIVLLLIAKRVYDTHHSPTIAFKWHFIIEPSNAL
jgi:hypothetical protein